MSLLRAFRQAPNTGEISQHEDYSTLSSNSRSSALSELSLAVEQRVNSPPRPGHETGQHRSCTGLPWRLLHLMRHFVDWDGAQFGWPVGHDSERGRTKRSYWVL